MQKAVCLAASAFALSAAAAAPTSYTIVDLGADQQPMAVNRHGVIVGYTISTDKPVVYEDGAWIPLRSLGTGHALAINAGGVIVGYDDDESVKWENGKRVVLSPYGASAEGISTDGTIVGSDDHFNESYCYIWKGGNYRWWWPLHDEPPCFAHAIDPTGRYIGGQAFSIERFEVRRGFIGPQGGRAREVGALGLDSESKVVAVNRHGHAAVWSQYDTGGRWAAAYWTGKHLVDIGLHLNGRDSRAMAINGSDDVLVQGADSKGHVLFLYAGRTGKTTPLEPLIANPQGWSFDYGDTNMLTAIGEDGQIYGAARLNGAVHAFKLVPGP